ncbi:MAG: hypothetical protein NPIRA06_02790 [Nitrospirales bacterium]|nr:MAG: hypothetical protein NPIRA06_02790 [Nitrospirales bacterium]
MAFYEQYGSDGPGILSMRKTRVKPRSYSHPFGCYQLTEQYVAESVLLSPRIRETFQTMAHQSLKKPTTMLDEQLNRKDGEGVGL